MNKVMRLVEADMKMEQVLQSFMVDLDVDSKNASVAGQALDMCLKLVAPEYAHKPWNRYREFLLFLEQRQVSSVLLSYKDSRFGCLSRAAAVLIYHFGHLTEFLSQNPHINNRLACLVREVMELPYLKVVLVVFACLGPHLQTVLARQSRDYGIDEETFPMDYPVSEQASNIDDTPVHNIGMERQCGKVDYRLKKLGTLNAVSRSIILQKSQELRDGQIPSFRGFKAAAQAKREVELNWSKFMKAKFESGADQKQEMAQRKERKRLDMLETLKSRGGPFTDSGDVEKFLVDESLNNNAKLQRMKLEVQFARESTKLLPRVDPIFRIQVTLPSGKMRMKTAQEFGDALMA
ncbi:hypothetical protein KUCAC02_001558 [Chaenocephalus aceratus]|uniref:Uncharacterized protein n=1 Tax=Chaenocephalus aceratus TaxID=36190 RepID=A0ACB9XR26_CHAAC|nr:hypothetical protein KUCAC02_001558 [Chaenocephalus aceratus]